MVIKRAKLFLIITVCNVQAVVQSPEMLSSSRVYAGESFTISCGPVQFPVEKTNLKINFDTIVLYRSLHSHPVETPIACYDKNSPNDSTVVIPIGRMWDINLPDPNKETLEIVVNVRHAHCSDNGVYRCSLYNGAESFDKFEELVVKYKLYQAPLLLAIAGGEKPKVDENVEGEVVTLICIVKGEEHLSLQWKYRLAKKNSSKSILYPHKHHVSKSISYAYRLTGGNCVLFHHESRLTIALHQSYESYVIMCVVTVDDVDISSRAFHAMFPSRNKTVSTMSPSAPFTTDDRATRLDSLVTTCLLSSLVSIFWRVLF